MQQLTCGFLAAEIWFSNVQCIHPPTYLTLTQFSPAEPIAEIILARHDKARVEYKNRFRGMEIAIMQDYK